MPVAAEDRPPYVAFYREAQETRNPDGTAGMARELDVAYVTPVGSKDRIPRIVSEWFPMLEQQVLEGRFQRSWLEAYKTAYEYWKKDEEPPVNGTSIKNWPVLTKAQVQNLMNLRITTVEDMAAANEETLNRVGMGSRNLKLSAQNWLDSQKDLTPLVARFTALEQKNAEILARNERLEADNAKLLAQVAALSTAA